MAKAITVEVNEKKKEITVVFPLGKGTVSKSGKSVVVASTKGNIETGVEYKGEELIMGCNIYYKNDE